MPVTYSIKINLPTWVKDRHVPSQTLMTMAERRLEQMQNNIWNGGIDGVPFAKTTDGRVPLGWPSGTVGGSFHPFVEGQMFGIKSQFVGAEILLKGTTGKGGTLPPIRPKRAKALRFTIGNTVIFAMKSEFPPRPYTSMSRKDRMELAAILFGKRPEDLNIV